MKRFRMWQGLVFFVLCASSAEAATTVFYCNDADRTVYGYVDDDGGIPIVQERANLETSSGFQADCVSGLKVATFLERKPAGQQFVVNADGTVGSREYPEIVQAKIAKASAVLKLEILGLTRDEIKALLSP